MSFRFNRRALLLAGRRPWLAFFRPRWGFAILRFLWSCRSHLPDATSAVTGDERCAFDEQGPARQAGRTMRQLAAANFVFDSRM
jgi:hypothetical protein